MSALDSSASVEQVITLVKELHSQIRDEVRRSVLTLEAEALSEMAGPGAGDVSYRIDVRPEEIVREFFSSNDIGFRARVVCEGIGVDDFPDGAGDVDLVFLIDPVDGSRELMYDKRSAWVLTGVAPAGAETLADIRVAVQTELPTSKQLLGSVAWAVRGEGAFEELVDVESGRVVQPKRPLRTSTSESLANGFASIVSFFPGAMREIADIAEGLFEDILGPVEAGSAIVFNDQYISTGGQMYLLATGRYRMIADLRPAVEQKVASRGGKLGMCCHPYDLATMLVAEEAGATIIDERGRTLTYPLDTETNCSWVGFANSTIRGQVESSLLRRLAGD